MPGAHPSPGHQPLPGAQPPPGQQPFPAQQSGPARQPVAGPVHAHGGAAGQGAGAPSGAAPGGSFGPAPGAPSVEATGPHFFDEDPDAGRPPSPEDAQHGSRPEPASAWGADRSRQAGYGGDPDHRVSWGSPPGADPRLPAEPQAAPAAPPAVPADGAKPDGTFVFRRPAAGTSEPAAPAAPVADEGTMTFRPVRTGRNDAPSGPGFGAGKAAAERAAAAQAQPVPSPAAPAQPEPPRPAPVPAPMAGGQGGGQPSWAQQVHRLAGDDGDQPVVPWKPPVEDVFQATARRRAEARPAPLGKRLAARLLDTVVVAAVTGAAAVPLGTRAVDHVDEKIDAAKLSGETVTVWLLDGTTAVYLGIVLAVLLLFGVVYEALPTARWGRTAGKRLFGLEVRDIEGHEPPGFGAALRRWLVYSVPGLLVFGVVGVLWCLFDRPWHQCWHDKAAHTFVAG
ncbi:RDD family protein [Streptomyces doudnae]|uniref:RDD family protein n=1 Tax=Streptomyces doudnae TaxID=3075536 RepID=UPI00374E005E